MQRTSLFIAAALLLTGLGARGDVVIDFEDQGLAVNSFKNNAGGGANGVFTSQVAGFNNRFSTNFGGIWSGWAMSSKTDGTTPGFGNQYSAKPGMGAGGSSSYGIGFTSGGGTDPDHPSGSWIDLPAGASPLSIDLTNTTYAYFSMKSGDAFSRKFTDGDFFKLDIRGYTGPGGTGALINTVNFLLADYSGGKDSPVSIWTNVDLSSLASARSLVFGLASSDNHPEFGMNTPAYFAADNLRLTAVPEPSSLILMALGGVFAVIRLRNKQI